MITFDIKNLPTLGFRSNAGDLGARVVGGRRLTYDPRGSLKYRADAGSFRYSWGPGALDEENSSRDRGGGGGPGKGPLVLLHRIGKGRGRCAIVYARVPPYRTHRTHSTYIPTTYTPSVCWRTDVVCAYAAHRTLSPATAPRSSLSVLLLFVSSFGLRLLMARPRPDTPKCQPRDNDEARTSSPPPSFLHPSPSIPRLRTSSVRYRVSLRLTP